MGTLSSRLDAQIYATAVGPIEAAQAGNGPAVLLVHGTGGSWRQVIALAEDLLGDWTVILVSRPGYGRTPIQSGRGYDDQAAAYAALLDSLGLARAAILGISGGGPSCLSFAARYPDRCIGLVLCSAVAPHLSSTRGMWAVGIPGAVEIWVMNESRRRLAAINDSAKRDRYLRTHLTKQEQKRLAAEPRVAAEVLAFLRRTAEAPGGVAGVRSDVASIRHAHDTASTEVAVRLPTLVLHGEDDHIVPVAQARYHAAAIPGGSLELYPGAGHLLLATHRRQTSARIRTFLSGLPTNQPPQPSRENQTGTSALT